MLIPSLYNRVYFDPDFDDCKALGDDRWDTLRLITVQRGNDPELLVAASGYGHTHTTVVDNLRTLPGYTRQSAWSTDSFILYYEAGAYYMDMDGKTNRKDDDRVPFQKCLRYFPDNIATQLRDLVKCREEHRM